MADTTRIEWTDATWNPVTGCTVTSPGCTNCYAMKLAGTRLQHLQSRKGLTRDTKAGPVWTGEVRFNEQWLTQPLRWKKPRRIFVCAHGDLFHESVPDEWIDKVFAVMALAPQHTFQVLTKRSARMREYMNDLWQPRLVPHLRELQKRPKGHGVLLETTNGTLPNVWLGVSVEDQTRADERIPDLLATPAAVRWISAEPLLGPVDLTKLNVPAIDDNWLNTCDALIGYNPQTFGFDEPARLARIDWVVAGGESGPGARPMHIDWAQSIVDQCQAAGVPVFVKQLSSGGPKAIKDIEQFPEGLRVREYPA
ncbi:MAG: phage Gp37/Gp68 family protein [Sphingomonadales bacterium]|nr:phage Gp37/Gp68 family protein [Sphingomonadales bacterium]MBU3993736.1 phage Gp37/Gp68 family protein [Alphaproteobacteria bacterium]